MGAGCGTSQISGLTTALGENLDDKTQHISPVNPQKHQCYILKVHSRLG
jgi:hypothetical protein